MAQYFEVLSQTDGNVDQSGQFFNGNPENEQTQVRYIVAGNSQQFPTQQVMVVDGAQQQIQGVVIDPSQITYQQTTQQQQFNSVLQNTNVNNLNNQPNQQIYYMEANTGQPSETVHAVQSILEQSTPIQHTPQTTQPPPIVLNHQIGQNSSRQTAGSPLQRPGLNLKGAMRPSHLQQTNPRILSQPVRQTLTIPRPHQTTHSMRPLTSQQLQDMRMRLPTAQIKQQAAQMQQGPRSLGNSPKTPMSALMNRQLNALQQQQQVIQQTQQQARQQQQVVQQSFRSEQIKSVPDHDELDDHDPSMTSTTSPMVTYKKLLEQRQQLGKNPILARLPSNIRVTPASQIQQSNVLSETIEQVVSQGIQQQSSMGVTAPGQTNQIRQESPPQLNQIQQASQMVQRKIRQPPRLKNPNQGSVRRPANARPAPRLPRAPLANQTFPQIRQIGPQQQNPRFPLNQQPRFVNQQQQMIQQRLGQQSQQQNAPPSQQSQMTQQQQQASQIQQNGGNQSQMNYLITPPNVNRPRQQRPLPSYIPSTQLQQIIESTPMGEEYSDSIRMLVLLENGEQRLITFTLPKEACTIQEILEQVNVPFTPETNIQVTEANTNGINYIVTVGNISNLGYAVSEEEHSQEQPDSQTPQQQVPADQSSAQSPYQQKSQPPCEPPKPPTPEPPKAPEPPKLIPGKLAVCQYCGYTGEDFNRCTRCCRKFSDNVRSVDAPSSVDIHKPPSQETVKQINANLHASNATISNTSSVKPGNSTSNKLETGNKPPTPTKKKPAKSKQPVENESVVISSDEEDDEQKPAKSVNEQLLKNLGASISISPVTKEPPIGDIKKHVRKLTPDTTNYVKVVLKCRTVRVGSYRFVPGDDVIIDSKCVVIKAPVINSKSEMKTIRIDRGDIVKVLICYNKSLPVLFYYLNVGAAPAIRDMLNMSKESGFYFDPIEEKEDSYRKITLLPEDFGEDYKTYFNQIYGVTPYNIIDELNVKEANDILIKACPKDTNSSIGSFSEIKQILLYPKEGQGRLSINTEDYVCLAVDQFLNDKIIDFYLKYLWENLPKQKQEKVHIFSTFFYKRLTTKPSKAAKKSHPFETDTTLSAAERRHCRVKSWTKRINLFEKDYIIVPINENAHWFLAIICFPWMRGPQTFDGKPYNPEPKPKPNKNKKNLKKEKPILCEDPLLSDKDEAESEDSDMESDDSEEVPPPVPAPVVGPLPRGKAGAKPPIKQPCILIFDSLAGPGRSRVVATLRDYLTVEHKAKMESQWVYNRDTIKGASCKVPQQTNFTDCGLYLLQYVEQFFKEPIKDYNIPIKGIDNWFSEIIVTKKREDICNLIKNLMEEGGTDTKMLPDIALPTINGKLLEKPEDGRDGEAGEEDMFTDIEDSEMSDVVGKALGENGTSKSDENQEERSSTNENETSSEGSLQSSPVKTVEGASEKTDFIETVVQPNLLKPTLSEFPRQASNKDTLNYLKSKRIIRHKTMPVEEPDCKKSKIEN